MGKFNETGKDVCTDTINTFQVRVKTLDSRIISGSSVNACWTFCPANRFTGVPKIVYMATIQGVKFIYILCKVKCNTILKFF